MSLKESLEEVKELAHMVMEDRKEEKTQAQREKNTVQLVCPYCGTSSRFVWEDGKLPTCPNCGATFDAEDPQIKKLREEKSQEADVQRRAQETAALESVKTRSKIRHHRNRRGCRAGSGCCGGEALWRQSASLGRRNV